MPEENKPLRDLDLVERVDSINAIETGTLPTIIKIEDAQLETDDDGETIGLYFPTEMMPSDETLYSVARYFAGLFKQVSPQEVASRISGYVIQDAYGVRGPNFFVDATPEWGVLVTIVENSPLSAEIFETLYGRLR